MDIQQLKSLIESTAKTITASEKLPLPFLAAKARRAAENRPTDIPLVTASQVLTKMASNNTFISRAELEDILNRFHATHSKLSDVFKEELGQQEKVRSNSVFYRTASEEQPLSKDYEKLADPLLANALSDIFSKNPADRVYAPEDAKKAQLACQTQLIEIGREADKISTFAGRKDFIICQAEWDTPIGKSTALIPVEMKQGKAMMPSLLLTKEGFTELTDGHVDEHMVDTAGKNFKVDGEKLIDLLVTAKNGVKAVSDVEMAVIRMGASNGTPVIDNPLFSEMIETIADVKLPTLPKTAEEEKIGERLAKPDGVARFVYGDRVVEAGRNLVVRKFAEIGYAHSQVKVADVNEKHIVYAVGVGTHTGFMVPVEVVGNNVIPPKVVIADGRIAAFSKQSINEVISSSTGGNIRALAAASPTYDLKPSELLDTVKQAIADGNYAKAEDAINVLGEKDPNVQKIAIAHMMMNIYEPGQKPSDDFAEMEKVANKSVQDLPVTFMTHKIFFPEGA